MKHFILAGEFAVNFLNEEKFEKLNKLINNNGGDIIGFDCSQPNALTELLEQLRGWHDFIVLTDENIKDIERNTSIKFDRPKI